MRLLAAIFSPLFAAALLAQTSPQPKPHSAPSPVSLHPRFAPGQVLRYKIVLETTTVGGSSGLVQDSAASGQLILTWNAIVRIDVLTPEPSSPAAMRLRTTYEKSSATVRTDSYDTAANDMIEQYRRLEGRAIEFALDAQGKVIGVQGLDDIVTDPKAQRDARQWIEQLSTGPGPSGSVASPGQQWTADQPAEGLPLAGMVWRTTAVYLRDTPCLRSGVPAQKTQQKPEMCAVIVTHLNLIPPKSQHDTTSDELRARGMTAAGTWAGSGESESYISLRSGWVIAVNQTGMEKMDVTVTNEHDDALRYNGTVVTRTNLQLVPD